MQYPSPRRASPQGRAAPRIASQFLLLVLLLLTTRASAQPKSLKVAFPKYATPPGWSKYNAKHLSTGYFHTFGGGGIDFPYRSFVRHPSRLVYSPPLANAVYTVRVGLIELNAGACKAKQRRFTIEANGKRSREIDLFTEAGCRKPYVFTIANVPVTSSVLKLSVVRVGGSPLPPILANVVATSTASAGGGGGGGGSGASLVRIAFTKKTAPSGWVKPTLSGFTPGVQFISSGTTKVAPQFTSYVKKVGGFSYTHTVPKAGLYKVTLGFAEISLWSCAVGKRVFSVNANSKSSGILDVFKSVGCEKSFVKVISNVNVGGNRKLALKVITRSGYAPYISNAQFQLGSGGGGGGSTPVNPSPPTGVTVVYAVNAGLTAADLPNLVTGSSKTFKSTSVAISGTNNPRLFSPHRYGKDFQYVFPVQKNIVYSVSTFFAESYSPACKNNFRVFDVSVYDFGKPASAKSRKALDVFKSAGCRTALTVSFNSVSVGSSGRLVVRFKSVVENAMVSGINVITTDKRYTGSTGPPNPTAPSPAPPVQPPVGKPPVSSSVALNVGPKGQAPAGSRVSFAGRAIQGSANVPGSYYKTSRYGRKFRFVFNLQPGLYEVTLGFAEYKKEFCSQPGNRVFNVFINGNLQLEGFDIFAAAKGCYKGVEEKLEASVSAVLKKPLEIGFENTLGGAQVSFIGIKSVAKCVQTKTGKLADSANHAAHSVPGSYPPQVNANSPKSYVDSSGRGFRRVRIDGGGSHTHFFDPVNNIIGRLIRYKWTIVETGEVISKEKVFSYNFKMGTTRLKLAVIDNSCTTDEAETTVTVTGAIQPGLYCYYYKGLADVPHDTVIEKPRPYYSTVTTSTDIRFPGFMATGASGARCTFFLETDVDSPKSVVAIDTFGTGDVRLFKGEDLIIDTTEELRTETALPIGLTGFVINYRRRTGQPRVLLRVNGKRPTKIFHDRKAVVPILSALSPNEGRVSGKVKVKVTGYGLYQPLVLTFGGKPTKLVLADGYDHRQFVVQIPPRTSPGVVSVLATSGSGLKSNKLTFKYGSKCDPVDFATVEMTAGGKSVDYLKLPTVVTLGNDNHLYMGTFSARVQRLGYNPVNLKVTSHCYSNSLFDKRFKKNGTPAGRTILGITFDPTSDDRKPYVTTSTMYPQKSKIDPTNIASWRNGAVDRLYYSPPKPGDKLCLLYDRRIVSNIPVSNHDHSVNAVMFTQTGELLISVAGATNAGLPGYKLGGFFETVLSGAILIAPIRKAGFDGNIKYSGDPGYKAKQIGGTVSPYARGMRNVFAMTMDRVGNIYAVDQGPNCGFGNVASKCGEVTDSKAAAFLARIKAKNLQTENYPGLAKSKGCQNSVSRPDKLLHITRNSYYGHANPKRGGQECAWVDPYTGKTLDGKPAPSSYKKPMATMGSPVTSIHQYRGLHFCGSLRDEMIMSRYRGRGTLRARVSGAKLRGGPDQLTSTGGISFVEDSFGNLIFPLLDKKKVIVLKPRVTGTTSFAVSGLSPVRHGKGGRTTLTIGGRNISVGKVSVTIGGKPCSLNSVTSTMIRCKVPAHGGGPKDMVVTSAGSGVTIRGAILYTFY